MNRLEKLIESLMATGQEDSEILASVLGRFCIFRSPIRIFSCIGLFIPDSTRTVTFVYNPALDK